MSARIRGTLQQLELLPGTEPTLKERTSRLSRWAWDVNVSSDAYDLACDVRAVLNESARLRLELKSVVFPPADVAALTEERDRWKAKAGLNVFLGHVAAILVAVAVIATALVLLGVA